MGRRLHRLASAPSELLSPKCTAYTPIPDPSPIEGEGRIGYALQCAPGCRRLSSAALFGVVAYSTYDLTNLATLKGYSERLTVIDMAWGAVLTAASASAGYFAAKALKSRPLPPR